MNRFGSHPRIEDHTVYEVLPPHGLSGGGRAGSSFEPDIIRRGGDPLGAAAKNQGDPRGDQTKVTLSWSRPSASHPQFHRPGP